MATDVISNLAGSLDAELEKARETLRNVDDDIKKVFGKEASELTIFGRNRRAVPTDAPKDEFYHQYQFQNQPNAASRTRRRDEFDRGDHNNHDDEPMEKRRRGPNESFMTSGRLGPMVAAPRFGFGGQRGLIDDQQPSKRLASRIVSSGKEKSREEVLAEQRQDRSGRERNRRMFGALMGTLQRFKQDETKLKDKEEKRAQIEAKLDEAAKQEREVVKTKKQELIRERRLRLTEIKRIEVKRRRLAELEQWEDKTKYLTNFIRTESKPHVFYLPKIMNPIMECRLEQSKQYVTEMISNKRKLVLDDLEDYEQRSKRYWEGRVAGRTTNRKIDPMDEDIEDELKEIMKNDDLVEDDVEDFTVTVFTSSSNEIKTENNGFLSIQLKEEKENIKEEPEEEMITETVEIEETQEELNDDDTTIDNNDETSSHPIETDSEVTNEKDCAEQQTVEYESMDQ